MSEREYVIRYRDPSTVVDVRARISGLAYLRGIMSGNIAAAPFFEALSARLACVESGKVVFDARPQERHYNPIGTVHGGWVASILDSAAGCAVYSALARGQGWTTTNLSVDFFRPIFASTGSLRCEGKTMRVGRRVAIADASLTDSSGKCYARGVGRCLLL